MAYIQGMERKQTILFPESIDDYIEEDNPVQFIDVFVNSLDLKELQFKYSQPESTGRPPYNPADMLKLYLYGYLNRIRSGRNLEKETRRNVELMWLLKKLSPDFKTIADFRKDNKKAIKKVCREFTLLCKKIDLFGGELIAIDSSKFKAGNSKKQNFNQVKLKKRIKEIEEKIETYLNELDENDKKEVHLPRIDKETLKAKIKLLQERDKKYKKVMKKLKESGHRQVSLIDPDSRAMVNNQKIEICYNVQVTVDDKHKLILDHEVTNEGKDCNQLNKMSSRAKKILEVDELEVLADKGYYNAVEIKECVDNGLTPYVPETESRGPKKANIPGPEFSNTKFRYDKGRDVYICPGGHELTGRSKFDIKGKMMKLYKSKECLGCQLRGQCTRNKIGRVIYRWEHEDILEDMRRRVEENPGKMKKRQWLSEHPFGTIKRGFDQGYMLTRGIEKVGAEISLSILAYNIKRTINIVGVRKLIIYLRQESGLLNRIRITGRRTFSVGTTTQTGKMSLLGAMFPVYPDRQICMN